MRSTISLKFLLLALFSGLFMSCNTTPLTDAIDNFGIVIELPEIETELSMQFVDAKTGELIDQPIKITFFGDKNGNAQLIDMYSDEISEFSTNTGFMNVGIQNGASVSESSPAVLGFKVEAEGYQDQNTAIEVRSEGSNYFVIELIATSTPPVGVSIVNQPLDNVVTDGLLSEDLNFSASEETGSLTPIVGLSLPEGTVLKDANGTPLSGRLSAEVVIYNPSVPEVMNKISPSLFQDEDSARVIYGVWETRVMDQSGRMATSMELPAAFRTTTCIGPYGTSTVNTITNGCAKQLPDAMSAAFDNPLFQNQIWWFGTPNPNPPQSFMMVEFEPLVDIPEWNRPQYGWLSNFEFEACVLGLASFSQNQSCSGPSPSNTTTISQKTEAKDLVVNISRIGHTSPLRVTLTSLGGYSETVEVIDGSSYTFTRTHAPVTDEDYMVQVQAATLPGGSISKTIDRSEYESGEVNISLPAAEGFLIDATLKVNLQCSNPDENPNITDIPTASFYYRLAESEAGNGYNPWRPTTDITFDQASPVNYITGGNAVLKGVIASKRYAMKLVYNDEVIEREVLVNGTQVEYTENLDDDICQ